MPVEVSTPAELDAVRNDLAESYVQVAGIDLDVSPYNTGEGWEPIGNWTDQVSFDGTYDGGGHRIDNLFIDRDSLSGVAIFGYIESGAEVQRFRMGDVDVTGFARVAGPVGRSFGSMSRVRVESGTYSGGSQVGGVVGTNQGPITRCRADVACSGSGDHIGGLVGFNSSAITESVATGNASSSGGSNVGGLAGWSSGGSIADCYARGNATISGAGARAGGLLGRVDGGTTERSYATGAPTAMSGAGGLIGHVQSSTLVSDAFWDTQTSGTASSDGGTGKTTAEMQDIDTYTDTATTGLTTAWDMVAIGEYNNETWAIDDGNEYPVLGWERDELIIGSVRVTGAHSVSHMTGGVIAGGNIDAPGAKTDADASGAVVVSGDAHAPGTRSTGRSIAIVGATHKPSIAAPGTISPAMASGIVGADHKASVVYPGATSVAAVTGHPVVTIFGDGAGAGTRSVAAAAGIVGATHKASVAVPGAASAADATGRTISPQPAWIRSHQQSALMGAGVLT